MARKKSAQFDGRANLAQAFYERALRANPDLPPSAGISSYPPVPLGTRWNPTRHQMAVLRSLANVYESEVPAEPVYTTRKTVSGNPPPPRQAYASQAASELGIDEGTVRTVRTRDDLATQVALLNSKLDALVTQERKKHDKTLRPGPLEQKLVGDWVKGKSIWAPPESKGVPTLAELKTRVAQMTDAETKKNLPKIQAALDAVGVILESLKGQDPAVTEAAMASTLRMLLPAKIAKDIQSKMRSEPSRRALAARYGQELRDARRERLRGVTPEDAGDLTDDEESETPRENRRRLRNNPGVTGLALARPNPSTRGQRSGTHMPKSNNPWIAHLEGYGGIGAFAKMSPAERAQVKQAYHARDNRSMTPAQIAKLGGYIGAQNAPEALIRMLKAEKAQRERPGRGQAKRTKTVARTVTHRPPREKGGAPIPITPRDIPTRYARILAALEGKPTVAVVPELVDVKAAVGGTKLAAVRAELKSQQAELRELAKRVTKTEKVAGAELSQAQKDAAAALRAAGVGAKTVARLERKMAGEKRKVSQRAPSERELEKIKAKIAAIDALLALPDSASVSVRGLIKRKTGKGINPKAAAGLAAFRDFMAAKGFPKGKGADKATRARLAAEFRATRASGGGAGASSGVGRNNSYLVAPVRENFAMGGFVDSIKQPANLQKLAGAVAGAALGYGLNSSLAKVEAIAPYAAWGVPVINLAGGAAVAYYGGRQFGAMGNLAMGAGLGLMAHGVLALAGKLMSALGVGSPSASAGFGNLYDQAFDGMGAQVYAAPAGVGRYIETGVSGLGAEVYAAPAGVGAEVYAAPAGFGRYVQTGPNNETPALPIANQPQTVLPQQINLPAGHSVLQGQTGVIRGGGIWDESVFGRIDSMPGI